MSGRIESPILNVLAVINEIELYPNWFPLVNYANVLEKPSRFQRFVHIKTPIPIPFMSDRDFLVHAYGVDNLRERYAFVYLQSVTDSYPNERPQCDIPEIPSGTVRINIMGGFLFKFHSKNTTDVTIMLNADPDLPVVPGFILNFVTRQVLHIVLDRLRDVSNFGVDSEYAKRIQVDRELYGYMEKIIGEMEDLNFGSNTDELDDSQN
eukprot:371655_1